MAGEASQRYPVQLGAYASWGRSGKPVELIMADGTD
jgi:hypothetical protein